MPTACGSPEIALQHDAWQLGAFTCAVVDASTEADSDRDGLISTNELAGYLAHRVLRLTGGRQTAVMEIRYGGTLFAACV